MKIKIGKIKKEDRLLGERRARRLEEKTIYHVTHRSLKDYKRRAKHGGKFNIKNYEQFNDSI